MKFIYYIIIGILVIIILYLVTCRKPVTQPPQVITVEHQHNVFVRDSVLSKHQKDSINDIINMLKLQSSKLQNSLNVSNNEIILLENSLSEYIAHVALPDSCKAIVGHISESLSKLIKANQEAAIACNGTISTKDTIIKQKDAVIEVGNNRYNKLVISFDTALSQQIKLQKYIDNIKPVPEIYMGVFARSAYQLSLNPTIGLSLGYRSKTGTQLELGGDLQRNIYLSIKKTLFKFK